MTKNQSLSLVAFSAVFVLFGFQNCSKVGVQDISASNVLQTGIDADPAIAPEENSILFPAPQADLEPLLERAPAEVVSNEQLPEKSPEKLPEVAVDTQPEAQPELPVDAQPEVIAELPKELPVVVAEPVKIEEPVKTEEPVVAAEPVKELPTALPPVVAEEKCLDSEECLLELPTEAEAAALCLDGGKHLKNFGKKGVLSGPEILKLRGNRSAEGDVFSLVKDVRGHLILKGKTSAAAVSLIEDTRGALVICGMIVDEIKNTRGQIILVNSIVKNLSNHRGHIRLMNSSIENSSDTDGKIKQCSK